MYYHATQERAEVMKRVHYTTWIKNQGESEKNSFEIGFKVLFLKADLMDAYQRC